MHEIALGHSHHIIINGREAAQSGVVTLSVGAGSEWKEFA